MKSDVTIYYYFRSCVALTLNVEVEIGQGSIEGAFCRKRVTPNGGQVSSTTLEKLSTNL